MASEVTHKNQPVIIVHGGAGAFSAMCHDGIAKETLEQGVIQAARSGWVELQKDQSGSTAAPAAVEAVQAAVMAMERNPNFNAGRGSCLTSDGNIEMDAVIMDGSNLESGGVIGIQHVLNPVSVARQVMDHTPHVLLAGSGATQFAMEMGHEKLDVSDLLTEKARKRLEKMPQFETSHRKEFKTKVKNEHPEDEHDTVGAAALDRYGNVAFATSTGGITAKLPGRVGDSPIVGCGGFADNDIAAVSTTGHGESFVKIVAAKHITNLITQGRSVQEAIDETLAYMLDRVGGTGGAIAVTKDGNLGSAFTTKGMAWASIKDNQIAYGVLPNEKTVKSLDEIN